jgi:hypothetical protein
MTKPLDAFTAAEIEAAMGVLTPRERRIFEALRPAEDLIALEELSIEFGIAARACAASECSSHGKGTVSHRSKSHN